MSGYSTTSVTELITNVESFVEEYMNQFDASHDFSHIQRVVRLAMHIARSEMKRNPSLTLDLELIQIAALLHDVNDRKYKTSSSEPLTSHLTRLGCSDSNLSNAVEDIVSHVSFNGERLNRAAVQEALKRHPELGIVQDADRIDAVGAVGIGRLFTYGGARNRSLDMSMSHLEDRLLRTADWMKTETGKAIITERMKRVKLLQDWWAEETEVDLCNIHD
jgi:uncharacterized protein